MVRVYINSGANSGGYLSMPIALAEWVATNVGASWPAFAGVIGALGAFIAGSNTVSNLMFSAFQYGVAERLALSSALIIALQAVGAAAGNMVAIHNVVAASATVGLLEAFSIDEVRDSLDNVALGALRVDHAVLPGMRKQGSGLLIHVSSTGGRIIVPFVSPYSAGKAALEAFAEEFSFELAPFGIESIILEAGGFLTEGLASGSAIAFPADEEIPTQYGEMATKSQEMFDGFGQVFSGTSWHSTPTCRLSTGSR